MFKIRMVNKGFDLRKLVPHTFTYLDERALNVARTKQIDLSLYQPC